MSVPHELRRPDRIYPVNDSHQCRSTHALADGHAEGQNKSRSGCQSVIQICCETTAALALEICGCLRLGPAHSFRQHKRRGDGNEPGIAQRAKRSKRRREKQQWPENVPATEASDNIAGSHQQEKLGEVFWPAKVHRQHFLIELVLRGVDRVPSSHLKGVCPIWSETGSSESGGKGGKEPDRRSLGRLAWQPPSRGQCEDSRPNVQAEDEKSVDELNVKIGPQEKKGRGPEEQLVVLPSLGFEDQKHLKSEEKQGKQQGAQRIHVKGIDSQRGDDPRPPEVSSKVPDGEEKYQREKDLKADEEPGNPGQAEAMLHGGNEQIKKPTVSNPRAIKMLGEYGIARHSMVREDPIPGTDVPPNVRIHNRGPRSDRVVRRDEQSGHSGGPLHNGRNSSAHVLPPSSSLAINRGVPDRTFHRDTWRRLPFPAAHLI